MPFPLRPASGRIVASLTATLFAALSITQAALADEGRKADFVPSLAAYKQECGACHVVYPPGMLPAASWQRIMNSLQRHYGADASLDATTVRQIATWLNANAGTGKRSRAEPQQDRITRSSWFVQEHRKVPDSIWKLAAVKSTSNCTACHRKADQGDFNEHDVRIPR
jgi:hypothetical protein